MKKQFRQGDVLIEAIDTIPAGTKPAKNKILALGETSGHGHIVTGKAEVMEDAEGNLFIDVPQEAKVEHLLVASGNWTEEHHPIALEAGKYKVIQQREYDPHQDAIRNVVD